MVFPDPAFFPVPETQTSLNSTTMKIDQSNAKAPVAASLIGPAATVFVASFCVMVIELVAARLIARQLGSSLYTWTAVIGVVLAGISLGNCLGGQIADRSVARKALATLFAFSSLTCVLTVILNNIVGELTWLWTLSWPARVFVHVLLVFILPSMFLGTISPVVAKMALDRGLPTGRTVGAIYAWAAVGSIAGTFAAGYWLIGAAGSVAIIWIVGGILLMMAILYAPRVWPFCICAVIFLAAMAIATAPAQWCRTAGATLALREKPDPDVIYKDETPYCYVSVKRTANNPEKREFIQDKLVHSEIVMGDITDLQYFYTKIYAAITHGLSIGKEKLCVLAIGGGGYVFPRYVENNWPRSLIEVVEIDPGVTKAAIQAFGLQPDTPIKTITMDARNYVDRILQQQTRTASKKNYDFIYGDAFSDYSAPYQLLTKEFNDKIAAILTDAGVYMLTVIDIYDYGRYLGALVNTLKQTFPQIYVITEARMPDWARNTFVVVAARRPLDLKQIISKYPEKLNLHSLNAAGMEYLKQKSKGLILTDDYAPVENLLAPVVRHSARASLARKYMTKAENFAKQGRLEQSIAFYKKAAKVKPQLTIDAYSQIGLIAIRQGNNALAVEACKKAIEYNKQTNAARDLADIRQLLETALKNLKPEKNTPKNQTEPRP